MASSLTLRLSHPARNNEAMPVESARLISKTSFLSGLQCPKLLWKWQNEPNAFPPVDEATQAFLDRGHEVGELAKRLYPGGIEVGAGVVHRESVVDETAELLKRRVPLPDHSWAAEIPEPTIGVLVPFRSFTYHRPGQRGSASIKFVLPTLTSTVYSDLAIQDGQAAARAFAAAELAEPQPIGRDKIRSDLSACCRLDTQAMADLVEALAHITTRNRL